MPSLGAGWFRAVDSFGGKAIHLRKWQVVLHVALVVLGAYWFIAIPAKSTPSGSQSASRFEPGPYQVISEDFEGVDEARSTPAYATLPVGI